MQTLKVLAKKIAPGQEHLDAFYESGASRMWFSDHGPDYPNIIFAGGADSALARLRTFSPRSTFGDKLVWSFAQRSEADAFAAYLMMTDRIHFWQVGVSDQMTSADQTTLFGFFRTPKRDRRENASASTLTLQTERMRTEAAKLFEPFSLRVGISAVILSETVVQGKPLHFSKNSRPLLELDVENSTASEEGLVYKPAKRRGSLDTKWDMKFYFYLFADIREAQTFFARASARGGGCGWHFSKQ